MTERELAIEELMLLRHTFKYASAMGTSMGVFLNSRDARIEALTYAINNIKDRDESKIRCVILKYYKNENIDDSYKIKKLAHEIATSKNIYKERE